MKIESGSIGVIVDKGIAGTISTAHALISIKGNRFPGLATWPKWWMIAKPIPKGALWHSAVYVRQDEPYGDVKAYERDGTKIWLDGSWHAIDEAVRSRAIAPSTRAACESLITPKPVPPPAPLPDYARLAVEACEAWCNESGPTFLMHMGKYKSARDAAKGGGK
jgi:hypothetical protein